MCIMNGSGGVSRVLLRERPGLHALHSCAWGLAPERHSAQTLVLLSGQSFRNAGLGRLGA